MPASAQSAATKSGFPKPRFFAVYSVCQTNRLTLRSHYLALGVRA